MSDSFSQTHKPTELRVKREEKVLEVDFDTGESFRIPAELLRVESPSAEVQGHGPGQKNIVAGRRHVGIMAEGFGGAHRIRMNDDGPSGSGRRCAGAATTDGRQPMPRKDQD